MCLLPGSDAATHAAAAGGSSGQPANECERASAALDEAPPLIDGLTRASVDAAGAHWWCPFRTFNGGFVVLHCDAFQVTIK